MPPGPAASHPSASEHTTTKLTPGWFRKPRSNNGCMSTIRSNVIFVRSATTTLMLEASRFMLLADLFRSVPAVYNTFLAYDEVAHHSGVKSPDAYKVLRQLDSAIESIERASASAPRPYRCVVLSDHGQTQGATFLQRYGDSLDQLVKRLISEDAEIYAKRESQEGINKIRLAVDEALDGEQRTARLFKRASSSLMKLEHRNTEADTATTRAASSDVVVLASSDVGLISFPREPGRRRGKTQRARQWPG